MPNVLLTPHMAGRGKYLNERRYAILRDNVRAMLSGGPLRNVVDKAHWF
jgi:phosphoglycerate dehydrogenase-like enzyme